MSKVLYKDVDESSLLCDGEAKPSLMFLLTHRSLALRNIALVPL